MNQETNDPLAMPATTVAPPTFPKLKPGGLHNFVIAEAKVGLNKEETGETLALTLKTTSDLPDTDGKMLNAGFPIYHYVGMTPTEKRTAQRIAEDTCLIIRCAFGKASALTTLDIKNNPAQLKDKIVTCKIEIKKASGDFPEGNKVTFIEPKVS